MREKRVSDLLNVKGRFLRSANIERDFQDPSALKGYVVTEFARSCLERVAQGLRPRSGERAWRMTGDYGSGKSSFALLLAHSFAPPKALGLPEQLKKEIGLKQLGGASQALLPILVTCSRQPLGVSILQGLRSTLMSSALSSRSYRGFISKLEDLLKRSALDDNSVLESLVFCRDALIRNGDGNGVIVILDELGKFLEYAAARSDIQDVFLLQRIAEEASRSGDRPLFVICLLHQGFNAYADRLNQAAQREWEKVAGRFEEIVFNQPLEQLVAVIGNALGVDTESISQRQAEEQLTAMKEVHRFGWLGSAGLSPLLQYAAKLYPLHPSVLPVLVRVFRRFGQNERSLFSFLLSDEPFGLQAFSRNTMNGTAVYRLYHFYDYVRANFGHKLSIQSYRSHWSLIESTIESFAADDESQVKILKTVGVLNLVNDSDLVATEQALSCALGNEQLSRSVEVLRKSKRVLYDRGRARGLCLWPHTSVDLQKAYEDASRTVDAPDRILEAVQTGLENRPLVARRHYIETGNLRSFDIRYCSALQLNSLAIPNHELTDGVCLLVLPENESERREALRIIEQNPVCKVSTVLIGVAEPLTLLRGLVREIRRWEWISEHTVELNSDRYAREEVSRQLALTRLQLQSRLQSLIGWASDSDGKVKWFWQSKPTKIKSRKELVEQLSVICSDVFSSAPRISNELVNRRKLSSAAAAARMRLIERMFAAPSEALLGMNAGKKPPEMSMYLSVLKETSVHKAANKHWQFQRPDAIEDRANLLPTLNKIRELVEDSPDSRINVSALFDELRKPPFGLRDGLIPLILSAFALIYDNETAFYKDGTYLPEFTAEAMWVLTKDPKRFDIQFCKIEGLRAELFRELLTLLYAEASSRKAELLTIVKQLCLFVAKLPTYAHQTRRLSESALAVRDSILRARDPVKLLFHDLPHACGQGVIDSKSPKDARLKDFLKRLRGGLQELQFAFPQLQQRIRSEVKRTFVVDGMEDSYRGVIGSRAEMLFSSVQEPRLRAFCFRLKDATLMEPEWIESIASFLALKPPSKWHDTEESTFQSELRQIASRFKAVEAIESSSGNIRREFSGFRLAITERSGLHLDEIVHFQKQEEPTVAKIQDEIATILDRHGRLAVAAASRAIWQVLERGRKHNA